MGAATLAVNEEILRSLVPLNALAPLNLEKIANKIIVEEVSAGRFLFKQGDRDNLTIYILRGEVALISENKQVGLVVAGTSDALYPVAPFQPRQVSAKTLSKVTVAKVDTNLLDVMLTWDQSSGYEVHDINTEDDSDWITKLLQSKALQKLPPSNIQKLLMRMEERKVTKAEVIIHEGDEGHSYFLIKKGRCEVAKSVANGKLKKLAMLTDGDSFGEDALLSDEKRNATVTMLTDGVLMTLSREDFNELLKEPLVNYIDYQQAAQMSMKGAKWLDVRSPDEYHHSSISGSINLPLYTLRHQLDQLNIQNTYIVCCDTGSRSTTAGFLLNQKGYNVHVLKQGITHVPKTDLIDQLTPNQPKVSADIIDFNSGNNLRKKDHTDNSALIGKLNQEILELNKKLTETHHSVSKLDELNQSRTKELSQLESEADTAQHLFDARFEKLNKDFVELSKTLHIKEMELTRVTREISSQQEKITDLLQHNKTTQDQLEIAQKQKVDAEKFAAKLSASNTHQEKYQNDLGHLENELQIIKNRNKQYENDIIDLKSKHIKLEQEKTHTADDANQLRIKIHHLEADLKDQSNTIKPEILTEEINKATYELKTSNSQLLLQIKAQEDQLSNQVEKNNFLMLQSQEDTSRISHLTDHHARLVSENQRVTASHEADNKKWKQLLAESNSKQDQVQLEVAKVENKFRSELDHVYKELNKAKDAMRSAQVENEKFKNELSTIKHDAVSYTQEKKNLIDELHDLHDKLLKAFREKAEAEVSKQAAEEELQNLKNGDQTEFKSARDQTIKQEYDIARLNAELGLTKKKLKDFQEKSKQNVLPNQELEQIAKLSEELEYLRTELQTANHQAEEKDQKFSHHLQNLQQKAKLDLERRLSEQTKQFENGAKLISDKLKQELETTQAQLYNVNNDAKLIQAQNNALDTGKRVLLEEIEDLKNEIDVWKNLSNNDNKKGSDEYNIDAAIGINSIPNRETLEPAAVLPQHKPSNRHSGQANGSSIDLEADFHVTGFSQTMVNELLKDEEAKPVTVVNENRSHQNVSQSSRTSVKVPENPSHSAQFRSSLSNKVQPKNISQPMKIADVKHKIQRGKKIKFLLKLVIMLVVVLAGASYALIYAHQKAYIDLNPLLKKMHIPLDFITQLKIPEPENVLPVTPAEENMGVNPEKKLNSLTLPSNANAASKTNKISVADSKMEPKNPAGKKDSLTPPPIESAPTNKLTQKGAKSPDKEAMVITKVGDEKIKPINASTPGTKTAEKAQEKPIFDPVNAVIPAEKKVEDKAEIFKPGILFISAKPHKTYRDMMKEEALGPILVEIPPGTFTMGAKQENSNNESLPPREISLGSIAITKHEISFAEYDLFAKLTGRIVPDDKGWGRGTHPVINVSWYDAKAYAEWLSKQTGQFYRLPSEAEWEYAAAAGADNHYWWGNDIGANNANCFNCASLWDNKLTAPVGSFAANTFGLHDTLGNAMEWTEDCYHPNYNDAPKSAKPWLESGDCSRYMVRGGAFSSPADQLKTVQRFNYSPSTKQEFIGFRLVRE